MKIHYEWRPIAKHMKEAKTGEVLLVANERENGIPYVSDVYHGWWQNTKWTRWPHSFPPTHFMLAPKAKDFE